MNLNHVLSLLILLTFVKYVFSIQKQLELKFLDGFTMLVFFVKGLCIT
jgi:hypothetical protein